MGTVDRVPALDASRHIADPAFVMMVTMGDKGPTMHPRRRRDAGDHLRRRRRADVGLVRPVVAASLVGALLPALLAAPVQAASPESTYAAAAVKATNTARVNHDRRELRTSACLRGFAARHARRMAAEESMYHQELGPIMEECGLRTAGENVAYGYPTGRAVVWKGWMRSEGHRANILSRAFRLVAVAARRSDDGTWYVAQVFGRRA